MVRLLKNPAIREMAFGLFGTFAMRGSAAILAFVMYALGARALGEVEFGMFATIFSALSILAIVCAFGQEMLIIRAWNEYTSKDAYGLARGVLFYGIKITVGLGFLGAIGTAIWFGWLDKWFLAFAAALFAFSRTVIHYTLNFARVTVSIMAADGHESITLYLPFLALCAAAVFLAFPISIEMAIMALAIGATLVLVIQSALIGRSLAQNYSEFFSAQTAQNKGEWRQRSLKFWTSAILDSSNQFLDVLIIAALMNPMAAGVYFVATRLANTFATAMDALYIFGSRRIPPLYYKNEQFELARVLTTMASMTALVVFGGLLVMGVGGELLLEVFHPTYGDYYWVLIILCVGTATVASMGPAASILNFTGYEGTYLKILSIGVCIRLIGFFILIPMYNIVGAAIAATISLLIMGVWIGISARKLTGIDASMYRLLSLKKLHPAPAE